MGPLMWRNSLYRKSPPNYNFEGKTIILVDDGAATGATTIVAARWIRNQPTKPKRLFIALPVTAKETATLLERECDRLEIIKPSSGQYYHNFGQISDEQVIQIMNDRNTDHGSMK